MSIVELVLGASARATVLLGGILVLCALRPRSAPALRHLALATGLFAALIMPLLSAMVPQWALPLPAATVQWLETGGPPTVAAPVVPAADATARSFITTPVGLLYLVWGGGTLLLLGRIVVGLRGVAQLRRSAGALGRSRVVAPRGRVRLLTSGAVEVPMAVGLLRPTVLLPSDAGEWTTGERRAALAHEFAHVRRGDGWTLLLAAVATAVHWPNPLVWLAARRLRAVSEEACDEAVLAAGVAPEAYAEVLVRLARRGHGEGAPRLAVGATDARGLGRRVEALLRGGHRRPRPVEAALLMGLLAVLVGCVAAARPVAAPASAAVEHAERYGIDVELAARILRAAAAEDLDARLAFGLVSVESGFDGGRTSPRGAVGLTQILPATAEWLAPGTTPEALRDPDVNLHLGFRLLRTYMARFAGDARRALLAYNVGPAEVERRRGVHPIRGSAYPARVLRAAGMSHGAGP